MLPFISFSKYNKSNYNTSQRTTFWRKTGKLLSGSNQKRGSLYLETKSPHAWCKHAGGIKPQSNGRKGDSIMTTDIVAYPDSERNTQTDKIQFILKDGIHFDKSINEYAVVVYGEIVNYAFHQSTAWFMYNEALRVRREHLERCLGDNDHA